MRWSPGGAITELRELPDDHAFVWRAGGPWTITVDFGHAPRADRSRVPTLIADILREHDATPAVMDVARLVAENQRSS